MFILFSVCREITYTLEVNIVICLVTCIIIILRSIYVFGMLVKRRKADLYHAFKILLRFWIYFTFYKNYHQEYLSRK